MIIEKAREIHKIIIDGAALKHAKETSILQPIEVKSTIGACADLGRLTTTPHENKQAFMEAFER